MVLYIVNTPIIAMREDVEEMKIKVKRISVEEAKEILNKEKDFTSAVGHESTATFMSKIFETEIPSNRIYVKYNRGDKAVCLKLLQRLPEGKVLSEEELEKIPYEIYLLEFY